MAHIQIYMAAACPLCAHSRHLAAEISSRYPQVEIELIDIGEAPQASLPESVFATPTWLWDGQLFSLGNPDPGRIWQRLAEASPPAIPLEPEDTRYGRQDAPSIDNGIVPGSIRKGT